MANLEHLKILEQGVEVWNKWREDNPDIMPDLSGRGPALVKGKFRKANFSRTNFRRAILREANLYGTNLDGAIFDGSVLEKIRFYKAKGTGVSFKDAVLTDASLLMTRLEDADMEGANLAGADLRDGIFQRVNFTDADLSGANMSRAALCNCSFNRTILTEAIMTNTDLSDSVINRANIYGLSAWNLKKDNLIQQDLIITSINEPEILIDDLEIAQFVYLFLNNQKIRDVIDTITSKAVLILGRFTTERKAVLDALKNELRQRNFLPIVFDFDKPLGKDLDETVNLLARMSRFVIADVTDAKSIPQELKGFVETNPSIPVVPLILKAQQEFALFEHFRRYPWVLPLYEYESSEALLAEIVPAIIEPAERVLEKHSSLAS